MGDFDGISTCELLKVLKRCDNRTARIFIHASFLRNICPLRGNVFHNNLGALEKQFLTLVSIEDHASQLAPEEHIASGLAIYTMPPVAQSGTPISDLSPQKRG